MMVELEYLRSWETCVMLGVVVFFARGMINCAIFKVGNAKCLCMINVTLCLSYLLHAMDCLLHFHVFIHLHIASHLGTLNAPREGCDVGAKPEDSV